MNAQEAYDKIIKSYPGFYGSEAIDFGSFFLFQLRPIWFEKDKEYLSGTTYPSIDKTNWKISEYNILTDTDAFLSAKRISVKNLFDKRIR